MSSEEKLNIKFNKGKIMVNNTIVRQKVQPMPNKDMLRMSDEELADIKVIKIAKGIEHVEKGSEFYGFVVNVKSEKDVQKAYQKLRVQQADATHITAAYRLENPKGPFRQGKLDDGEPGAGRRYLPPFKMRSLRILQYS